MLRCAKFKICSYGEEVQNVKCLQTDGRRTKSDKKRSRVFIEVKNGKRLQTDEQTDGRRIKKDQKSLFKLKVEIHVITMHTSNMYTIDLQSKNSILS